jgi:hypothetical protein
VSLGEPVEIWFTPRGDGAEPCLSVEFDGGPKRYMRIWLDAPHNPPEWGWTLYRTAERLWTRDDGDGAA